MAAAFSWNDEADLDRIEKEVRGAGDVETLCYALAHITEENRLPSGFTVDHAYQTALRAKRDGSEEAFSWGDMWSVKLSADGQATWQKIYSPWADGLMTLDAFIATLNDWRQKPGTGYQRFEMTVGCSVREWDQKHRGVGHAGVGATLC